MTQDCITQNELDEIENILGELQYLPKVRGDELRDTLLTTTAGLNLSSYVRRILVEAIDYASNSPEQNWIRNSKDRFSLFKSKVTVT